MPVRSRRLTSERFFDLMRKRNRRNAAKIDRGIEGRSLADVTVLMADSSGFSRKTHQYGILQFLSVMTHCYDRIIPLLERRRGICLSRNADNIVAMFEDPADAVQAAIDMHRWLLRRNRRLPDAEQYNICIGINCGTVIRLADNVYGDMVNIAAKMGEDLAGKDEILVTREVAERIRGRFASQYDRSTEIGGQTIELHRIDYPV